MTLLTITTTAYVLLTLSVFLTGVSIVLAYTGRWWVVIAAYLAFILGKISGATDIDSTSLIFWGASTLIVLGINWLLPEQIRCARIGLPFMCTGAMVGAVVGLLLNTQAGVITASAIGAALAMIAFTRQRAGQVLDFPSQKFFNYLCAKGLPLVVIFSMLGILCLQFINLGAKL